MTSSVFLGFGAAADVIIRYPFSSQFRFLGMCVSSVRHMCIPVLARCCAISRCTWFEATWSGFRLAIDRWISHFFGFFTRSRFPFLGESRFYQFAVIFRRILFWLVGFSKVFDFSFIVWGYVFLVCFLFPCSLFFRQSGWGIRRFWSVSCRFAGGCCQGQDFCSRGSHNPILVDWVRDFMIGKSISFLMYLASYCFALRRWTPYSRGTPWPLLAMSYLHRCILAYGAEYLLFPPF